MLRKPGKAILPFFLCLVFLFPGNGIVSKATVAGGAETLKDCDIQQGPCTETMDGLQVTLDILPKPVKAMKELTFRLSFSGRALQNNPYIDLNMPGMDMGPNRVMLKRLGDNSYAGQGVIVRCTSGRRTWKATVTLPGAGVVDFVFDVIY